MQYSCCNIHLQSTNCKIHSWISLCCLLEWRDPNILIKFFDQLLVSQNFTESLALQLFKQHSLERHRLLLLRLPLFLFLSFFCRFNTNLIPGHYSASPPSSPSPPTVLWKFIHFATTGFPINFPKYLAMCKTTLTSQH